jgi:hypothetical protein
MNAPRVRPRNGSKPASAEFLTSNPPRAHPDWYAGSVRDVRRVLSFMLGIGPVPPAGSDPQPGGAIGG